MDNRNINDISRLYIKSFVLLFVGIATGFVAAYFFSKMKIDLSHEIEQARSLGIVSMTTLDGYPKSRDVLNFMSIVILPVLGATGLWAALLKPGERIALKECITPAGNLKPKHIGYFAALAALWLYVSFNLTILYSSHHNSFVGNWPFLGEEGVILAWTQSILDGQVYARDFSSLYGPMLLYPVAWFMNIFGETVLVFRIYSYILNIMAGGIILYSLFSVLRTRTFFIIAVVMAILVYQPLRLTSPHTSDMRVALGLLPIIIAYVYMDRRNSISLTISGAVVGQSFLLSQEVGICSAIALGVFLLLDLWSKRDFNAFRKNSLYVLGGGALSVLPMLLYFAFNGALLDFIKNMYLYPRMFSLGYGSIPFTSFVTLLKNPFGMNSIFPYWIISIYILTSILVLIRLILNHVDRRLILMASLLAFGIVLFRVALGRSAEEKTFFCLLPAFILLWMHLEDAVLAALRNREIAQKATSALLALVLLASFLVACTKSNILRNNILMTINYALRPDVKLSRLIERGHVPLSGRGGGVYVQKKLALQIRDIERFLAENTRKEDHVYFFPLEAAFYFLYDRKSPTRYPLSYHAITFDQQRELVSDLKKNSPMYIIYSMRTWRVDGIMEDRQIPLVFKYIWDSYRPLKYMGDIMVLKKIQI